MTPVGGGVCHRDFVPTVKRIPSRRRPPWAPTGGRYRGKDGDTLARLARADLDGVTAGVYNNVDIMRRRRPPSDDSKTAALRAAGALHPHPEAVQDEAFTRQEFFDRRDRVQVRYEMLRGHRVEGRPVTQLAMAFGVSRQAFYMADAAFAAQGIPGLLPRKRGPTRAHKCTDEVLDFAVRWGAGAETVRGSTLIEAIARRFGVRVHPRSLARALARREKKRRTRGAAPS